MYRIQMVLPFVVSEFALDETLFRGLGDEVGLLLGTGELPGDASIFVGEAVSIG
jgi:hypothetical protein